MFYSTTQQRYEWLHAVGFTAHWLSLGIFTGAYIKVGTQTPLLQPHKHCSFAPVALNVGIFTVLAVSFYFEVQVDAAS